jgi:hypothetical protein
LLSEIATAKPDKRPGEIVMVRGGIERYMKTFPEGGHWAGANYVFDRRLEQVVNSHFATLFIVYCLVALNALFQFKVWNTRFLYYPTPPR